MSAPTTLRTEAIASAMRFHELAAGATSAKEAADWSLAAKNCIGTALACVQTEATLANAKRESKAHSGRRGY